MRDANGLPLLVVTADETMTDQRRHYLGRDIEAWIGAGGKLPLVVDAGVHVAAEQPDGTWVRICHDHAQPSPVALAEVVTG